MAPKKQAPQRMSEGVYRMPNGNLRQMQAPRPQQRPQVPPMRGQPVPPQAQPMPQPPQGGQFGGGMPQQQLPAQMPPSNYGQSQQLPPGFDPMAPQTMGQQGGNQGFSGMQSALGQGLGQIGAAAFGGQPNWGQMARNDPRTLAQFGQYQQQMSPQMQQAFQYYQQNPQAMQQTQQGMQTLMPQNSKRPLLNEAAAAAGMGLMSMPPGVK